jgi:hypothetical protein
MLRYSISENSAVDGASCCAFQDVFGLYAQLMNLDVSALL